MRCAAKSALNAFLIRETRYLRSFSTSRPVTRRPKPSLDLDPTLHALLRDVDISLARHKSPENTAPRELDVLPPEHSTAIPDTYEPEERVDLSDGLERKSPAALFGSQRIGAVVLPIELQNSINILINGSNKTMLHTDAKRLFVIPEEGSEDHWNTNYDTRYRSRQQASRHSERDGTAFATIALPAHYSAIKSVLQHLKHRMNPDWEVRRVIDWGAGTGSGLWAALHTFQQHPHSEMEDFILSNSVVESYLGIDKRDGLVNIGKRLLNADYKNTDVSWQRSFQEDDKISRSLGYDTLALSAFYLSSLPTHLARKALVKQMWESGAHTLVLIDHNSRTGFENIAEARETLLSMGRKEMQDPATAEWPIRGSHVVAPCPHDGECPLYRSGSSRIVCGFSQRLQTPSFIRHTKRSGAGHEDVGYSYVIVRRGVRPTDTNTRPGRIGTVGLRQLEKETEARVPIKELTLHSEHDLDIGEEAPEQHSATRIPPEVSELQLQSELDALFRQESYHWPRLVFPPLKRSGHIILDSCTAEGKIMRLTVPRSQGKQPYYDARKSVWGDMFPHEPKNKPQERFQPRPEKRRDRLCSKGSDIAKRRGTVHGGDEFSYEALTESLKKLRKKSKRNRLTLSRASQKD